MSASPLPDDWATAPSGARLYDFLCGGKNHLRAERMLGKELLERARWLPRAAKINRAHGALIAQYFVRQGLRLILDLGCGYPSLSNAQRNVYEAAASISAGVTVVHVDHDPVVAAHARALLTGPEGHTRAVCADVRKLDQSLVPELDPTRPWGVLLHDVLPWIPNDLEAHNLLADLRDRLPPGSAISITHLTADMHPGEMEALAAIYEEAGLPVRPRTRDQIRELLAPWPLAEPGLVPTNRWFDDRLLSHIQDERSAAYAAVAWHPSEPR
ncbi:SAM-dependent methyltransferase [Streptomyces lydicus]|uniref:SAM-dependent methyltransferase n=1 Tax=Streptomyces lydicus TaxID=47763 RepID=UPI0036EB1A4F